MTLQSSQAWKGHVQCQCPEFSMLQPRTFVQCSHSGTVHGAPCAHYRIWISWQSLCHLHFAYEETEAIRSSSWIKWSNPGGLIPECTLYPFHHSFLQVHIRSLLLRVFDGAKLLFFHFSCWSVCPSVSLPTNTSSCTRRMPALFQEMAVLFACQELPSTKSVAWK